MKTPILISIIILMSPIHGLLANNSTVDSLLQDYQNQGAVTADMEKGRQLWKQKFINKDERSCSLCHTNDLTRTGKHIKTGKLIKPMSPSVNKERLTDRSKIKKWFKRNCKWTLGRECTVQEKSDFLIFIENSSKF